MFHFGIIVVNGYRPITAQKKKVVAISSRLRYRKFEKNISSSLVMKFKELISFMKSQNLAQVHILENSLLVVDGKSFFGRTYKTSGCSHILGGEYDKFAKYLREKLSYFIESNVTCYVVFNGDTLADDDTTKKKHEHVLNEVDDIDPSCKKKSYYEPLFVTDVCKQVLEELGIKYIVDDSDALEAMFSVAKYYHCPILTKKLEYCYYGVSCVSLHSLRFEKDNKRIKCKIFNTDAGRVRVKEEVVPIFLTLADEDDEFYDKINDITGNLFELSRIPALRRWINRLKRYEVLDKVNQALGNRKDQDAFSLAVKEKFKAKNRHWPIKCFENPVYLRCDSDKNLDTDYWLSMYMESLNQTVAWFKNGVATGRVAVPYIKLVKYGTLSGSTLVYQTEGKDAMLSAIEIVAFAYGLLTGKKNIDLKLIGRKLSKCCVWSLQKKIDLGLPENMLKGAAWPSFFLDSCIFQLFLDIQLPGFDVRSLEYLPEESRILYVTLLYYVTKDQDDFSFGVYSILLSYLILDLVAERYNIAEDDGLAVEEDLKGFFDVIDIENIYNRGILHKLAEFQHCLQHMNYLNNLCGQRFKGTIYHKTLNMTFIYNMYLQLMFKEDPKIYVSNLLKRGTSVILLFEVLTETYEKSIKTVHIR